MKVGHKTAGATRPSRGGRNRNGMQARRPHETRAQRQGPQTAPLARPVERPSRAKSADQAKARAKARKAKAPKVIRRPLRERLRERLIVKLAGVDLRPQTLLARIPFVVLVIGALAVGLAITLWLSTDAAQRSYQLGSARAVNEALDREVLEAQSAPALADSARDLGMIPSRDTAHLVLDPAGNWIVVGQPKPAAGAPPPPLNTKLPEEKPPAASQQSSPVAAQPKPGAAAEVPNRLVPLVPPAPVLPPVAAVPPAPLAPTVGAEPGSVPAAPPGAPVVTEIPPLPAPPAPAGLVLEPVLVDGAPQ